MKNTLRSQIRQTTTRSRFSTARYLASSFFSKVIWNTQLFYNPWSKDQDNWMDEPMQQEMTKYRLGNYDRSRFAPHNNHIKDKLKHKICPLTGRAKAVGGRFDLSRVALRTMLASSQLSGLRKSSW